VHVEHAAFDDCATREERGERLLALLARLYSHERGHDVSGAPGARAC
jgi:hypothetical protein